MNETLKEKFNNLFNSLNLQENLPFLETIYNSEEFNLTKSSFNLVYKNKISECSKILNELKSFSEREKEETLDNYKIVINSTPKKGKEREFKDKVTEFHACYDKFLKVDSLYSQKNNFLEEYVQKGLDYCITNNCEKLIQASEEGTKNCIRDCFKYNQYNSYIMTKMINDELLKFKNEIEKI